MRHLKDWVYYVASGESTWVDIKEHVQGTEIPIAILPLGAVEAHGPHLPLVTDSIIAEAIAIEVARRTGAFVLPTLHYGSLWSLRNFPGSISVSAQTLANLIYEIGISLKRHGYRLFVVVNAHIGNMDAIKEGLRRLIEDGLNVMVVNPSLILAAAEGVVETPRWHKSYYHAEEIETSLVLHLRPELVRMSNAVKEYPPVPFDFEYTFIPWDEITKSGVLGDPTSATPRKGKIIFEKVVTLVTELINKEIMKLKDLEQKNTKPV